MIELKTATLDDFSPLEGRVVTIEPSIDEAAFEATLIEASSGVDPARKNEFALLFRANQTGDPIEQQICKIVGDGFGDMELFLVPIGTTDGHPDYEAVFT
ncbi:MAG: hypothetical protein AAGD38_24560 [Acidobacteriota bacterium]